MTWAWLGRFSVRVEWSGGCLYVDPYLMKEGAKPADLVLVSNPRVGHWSPEDVDLVRSPRTQLLGPAGVAAACAFPSITMAPGDEFSLRGLTVRAIPAYTLTTSFFPRAKGWLGWLITADGETYYHAGASERIPEMDGLRADTAFLPVSGRYVMDGGTAREVGKALGAATLVGTGVAGDRFHRLPGFWPDTGRPGPASEAP